MYVYVNHQRKGSFLHRITAGMYHVIRCDELESKEGHVKSLLGVNLCLLGWTTMNFYVIKHHSKCSPRNALGENMIILTFLAVLFSALKTVSSRP